MNHHKRSSQVTAEQLQMINKAIFGHYDVDNNGFLEESEVKSFMVDVLMNGGRTQQQAEEATKMFYRQVDKNGDGKISKEEFNEIMRCIIQNKVNNLSVKRRNSGI